MAMAMETATPASAVVADGPIVMAAPTISEFMETQRDESECEATFNRMSNGTGFVDLEGYLDYFGVSLHETETMETGEVETDGVVAPAPAIDVDTDATTPVEDPQHDQEKRARFREMLIKHFGDRDVNGDGFLDKAEMDALM
jgi:hypothetical protein